MSSPAEPSSPSGVMGRWALISGFLLMGYTRAQGFFFLCRTWMWLFLGLEVYIFLLWVWMWMGVGAGRCQVPEASSSGTWRQTGSEETDLDSALPLKVTKLLGLMAGGVQVLDRKFSILSVSCSLGLEMGLPGGWASLVPVQCSKEEPGMVEAHRGPGGMVTSQEEQLLENLGPGQHFPRSCC